MWDTLEGKWCHFGGRGTRNEDRNFSVCRVIEHPLLPFQNLRAVKHKYWPDLSWCELMWAAERQRLKDDSKSLSVLQIFVSVRIVMSHISVHAPFTCCLLCSSFSVVCQNPWVYWNICMRYGEKSVHGKRCNLLSLFSLWQSQSRSNPEMSPLQKNLRLEQWLCVADNATSVFVYLFKT